MELTYGEGLDGNVVEAVQIAIETAQKFLDAVGKLGLAISLQNFAMAGLSDPVTDPGVLSMLERDSSNLDKPFLAEFEQHLASLHVRASDRSYESAPSFEVVWSNTTAMQRFGAVLDWAWQTVFEYGEAGSHRALDQVS